eukprot:1619774-Rhodomonas_salina.4
MPDLNTIRGCGACILKLGGFATSQALGWMLLFLGLVDISGEDEAKVAEAKKKQYSLMGSIPRYRSTHLLYDGTDTCHVATRWFHTGNGHPPVHPEQVDP